MVELKMHKPPRGMDQKTIIQHVLKFTTAKECFQSFRLVSKFFQDAVETIKFNRKVDYDIFEKIPSEGSQMPVYLEKYLKHFRKLDFPMTPHFLNRSNLDVVFSLFVNNMTKLNYIHLNPDYNELPDTCDLFISQILENSKETLQELSVPKLVMPDVFFPKLKTLQLEVGININLHEFKAHLEKAVTNMERLEKTGLCTWVPGYKAICEYVAEKYGKHCISAEQGGFEDALDLVPVKILTFVSNLEELRNAKYAYALRYFHAKINENWPTEDSWGNYRQIFDQFSNLEAIELEPMDMNWQSFITDVLPNLLEPSKKIWQERISYFEKCGIKIMEKKQIVENGALELRLAKEAGVTWRFHIY
jgi:hypothetical protein